MALLGKFDESYTKTGNGWLQGFVNKLSFIPVLGPIISGTVGYIETAIESIGWLIQGKPVSALTAAATGFVGNSVNAVVGGLTWWNVGSGVATGRSIGTHARKLTEEGIGALTGVLGMKPTVLQSNFAAIGEGPGAGLATGPGQFATAEAARRGQDANAMYANYMRGEGGVHVNELGSAAGRA